MRQISQQLTMITTLMLVAFLCTATSVSAQLKPSPSPSAESEASSPSGELSLDTTEKLKARIEKIVEERRNQIMGAINEVGRTRKGFIGEVQRVSAETITIKTSKGPQILSLSDEVMLTKKGKTIAIESVTVGDWAMVIGVMDDDTFTPEIIDISSESLKPKTQKVMLGTLTEVKKTTLKVKHRTQNEEDELSISKQSEFVDSEGNELELKNLKTDMQVLIVAQQGANGLELSSLKLLSAVGGVR